MRKRTYKWTKEEVLEKIDGSFGILSLIQGKLGISRDTLRLYRQRWPEIDEAIKNERGRFVGAAEEQLRKKVKNGSLEAIKFVLSRLGKDDGWGDEQTVNVSGDGVVQPIIMFDGGKGGGDGEEK